MAKKKVDFVIRYEHKVRELESIMLLKLELERRGYSVAFVGNYDYKTTDNYQPKVFVSPSLYSDVNILGDLAKYGPLKKIANLLWEQLIGLRDEVDPKCTHNVVGLGQRAISFCWGQQSHDRICRGGVSENNAPIVGQLNCDLLKPAFRSTLKSKFELGSLYGLDVSKRWNFFISSFAYCELDEIQKELCIKDCGEENVKYMTDLSNDSRAEILSWFEEILKSNQEDIFIYRPHPDEARKSLILQDLEKKYDNFRVLSQEALKHWINASDKIYNWYSTGHIDSIVLGKPATLLRPVKIREEDDYRIYYDAKSITTLQEFLDDYHDLCSRTGLNMDVFNSYYYIPSDYTYLNVCDILEDMLITEKYDIQYTNEEYRSLLYNHYKCMFKKRMKFLKPIAKLLPYFRKSIQKQDAYLKVLKDGYEKNVITEQDIEEATKRLKPIIDQIGVNRQ